MRVGRIEFGWNKQTAQELQADSLKRLARATEAMGAFVKLSEDCQHCHKRPGTHNWVGEGGTLAHVHGLSVRWCEVCVVEAQLAHARKVAASIPTLEARLLALGATVAAVDPVGELAKRDPTTRDSKSSTVEVD